MMLKKYLGLIAIALSYLIISLPLALAHEVRDNGGSRGCNIPDVQDLFQQENDYKSQHQKCPMNERDYVVSRLKQYSADQISLSSHAKIRLAQRQISEKEVIENLIKPNRLEYAIKEESQDQKFDCYFGYT